MSPVTPSRQNPHPVPTSGCLSPLQQQEGFPTDPAEGTGVLVPPPHGTEGCGMDPNHPQSPSSHTPLPQQDPTRIHPPISHGEMKGFLPSSCETIAEMGLALPDSHFSSPFRISRTPGSALRLFQHRAATTWAPGLNIHEPKGRSKRRAQLGSKQRQDAEIFQEKRGKEEEFQRRGGQRVHREAPRGWSCCRRRRSGPICSRCPRSRRSRCHLPLPPRRFGDGRALH